MSYHDIAIQNPELNEKREELGWDSKYSDVERDFISSNDWGTVKRKINSSNSITLLESPSPDLSAKAVKLDNLDAILSPESGRKDPGINHVIAKAAEKNDTSVVLEFKNLLGSRKNRMHTLSSWRTIIQLSEKYGFSLILSTGAEKSNQLRNPKDLESLLKTLEVYDSNPLSSNPKQIMARYV
ncbi:MAG: ribonuclease P/MRP protein subunit RPP1 [Candidatus Nanohaloarchaea archaeon]|jgi:ribonuclease P/MRP protein subunit RPP1